jgi:hypothetical protein
LPRCTSASRKQSLTPSTSSPSTRCASGTALLSRPPLSAVAGNAGAILSGLEGVLRRRGRQAPQSRDCGRARR